MNTSFVPQASGRVLDTSANSLGELRRSDDIRDNPAALRERLLADGYLYVPGFFPREDALAVRDEFFRRLAKHGALHPAYPVSDGVVSEQPVNVPREAFLTGNDLIPKVVFAPRLLNFYQGVLGGPIRPYDHVWLRVIRPGRGTFPHCDLPYMGRGTRDVFTAWVPCRDTSLELGGLMVLEKSHLQAHRIENYLRGDADTYCVNRNSYKHKFGQLSNNPVTLREKFQGRWLTTGFRAGDLLTFGMTLVHGSLDNQTNQYRLSTDTRYQLAGEPIDERWVGPGTEEWAARNRVGMVC